MIAITTADPDIESGMTAAAGKHFIFLYTNFDTAGIQTQMLRVANYLAVQGHTATIAAYPGGLEEELHPAVNFFSYKTNEQLYRNFPTYCAGVQFSGKRVVLWGSHVFDMLRIRRLQKDLLKTHGVVSSGVCGIHHPRACFKPEDNAAIHLLCRLVFMITPKTDAYFMNKGSRDSHAQRWRTSLDAYPIMQLTYAPVERAWTPQAEGPLRVVSVGRVVPWKAYNRGLVDIADQLRASGLAIEWTIWGGGSDLEPLRQAVRTRGLEDLVLFNGPLAYKELNNEFLKHDVFVGMGSSLLEAARLGLPAICAIDQDPDHSYGFFHEVPAGTYGEVVPDAARIPIRDLVQQYAGMDPAVRVTLGDAGAARARRATSDMREFVSHLAGVPDWSPQSIRGAGVLALAKAYESWKSVHVGARLRRLRQSLARSSHT